jgi:hypothetical protein
LVVQKLGSVFTLYADDAEVRNGGYALKSLGHG